MSRFENVNSTIGRTPIIKLNKVVADCRAEVYLKCEFFNPLASVKDRIGISMIETAEQDGKLGPESIVIEPTSGNTGIALAFVCASKGYKCVLTMPETMSKERRVLLRLLGSDIILTPGPKGMPGAIAKAGQLMEEVWADTEGNSDAFVAGVGTGGTITGVSEVIKQRNPSLLSVVVEPEESPVITQTLAGEDVQPGPHKIQGIGAGFVPKNLNLEIVDEVERVNSDDSFAMARRIGLEEGILVGISTGATVTAALRVAKRPEMEGKRIVVIAASTTERYLSTPLAEQVREEVANLPVSEI